MLTVEHFSCVDIYGAFSKHLTLGRRQARTHGGEWKTACPWCGGTDRFAVWPFRDDGTVHFWCRGCDEKGDVVAFLQRIEGLTFLEACAALNVPLDGDYSAGERVQRSYQRDETNPPPRSWQEQAFAFALTCRDVLWSEAGAVALTYLRARGISDETIRRAGLGYQPDPDRKENKADWGIDDDGKKLWIPRGIVIPWQVEGQLWALNIRRPKSDIEKDKADGWKESPKYWLVKGSSEGIYGIDAVTANVNKPVLVVEGEFDKLIAEQEAGDLCTPLATGGARKGRGQRWTLLIAQSPTVLIGFDADEAGRSATKEHWLPSIPHALPWQPWQHDITEMQLSGQDVREWLRLGIEVATQPIAKETPAPESVQLKAARDTAVGSLDRLLGNRLTPARQDEQTNRQDAALLEDKLRAEFWQGVEADAERLRMRWEREKKAALAPTAEQEDLRTPARMRADRLFWQGTIIPCDEYTPEEMALASALHGCAVRLHAHPCRRCGAHLVRDLFGSWECAACEPYNGWPYATLARIHATRPARGSELASFLARQ